ncbi:hypothetical protein QMO56_23110 [Roseomonas sp. E05]|uniref:hypothetical protein n=1 Tax=Roseomonas sp. E05 TaxID=3046310 RepID=UPI0024BBA97A|nr:hypothetical protein [Roseomonas sp. E05]MDJ0391012.1 hypothetical protein [Roseomonas sp. E05]
MTWPLGASLGDRLSQPVAEGGMGSGTVPTSLLFLLVIGGLVLHLSRGASEAGSAPRAAAR